MNDVLRKERKYLLSTDQYRRLNHLLEQSMRGDPHNGWDGYRIRSLYFDTPDNRDYVEKMDGVELRRKFRLRIYDPKMDYAMFEMKQKQGFYQRKRSLRVSREDAIRLCQGDYSPLMEMDSEFAHECYVLLNMHLYQPKTIVDYSRMAYIANENNIRITFDSDIRATEASYDLFDENLNMNPVLDPYLTVLEVKYNGFLLDYVKDLVSMVEKEQLSVSKYALARNTTMHYVFV